MPPWKGSTRRVEADGDLRWSAKGTQCWRETQEPKKARGWMQTPPQRVWSSSLRCPKSARREQGQREKRGPPFDWVGRRQGNGGVHLRGKRRLESTDQVNGVNLPTDRHDDIGELVTHLLNHLSTSTRFTDHPPPYDSTFVALADSQVTFFFQLGQPDAEAADVGIHGLPSPLGRRTHAQPSRTIQSGARRSLELAGLRPHHLGLGGDTKSAGCSY
ncbi:hypothetical protein PF003_g18721 [Phytophthora fragariae]|nr:hypothetical protein PF003_g18721 [Phytophthora fragariae]